MNKLKCKICGLKSNCLTTHIIRTHNMSVYNYKKAYNVKKVQIFTKVQRKKMSDNAKIYMNTPEVRKKLHDNVVSCWKKEYWIKKGYDEQAAILKIKELQIENCKKYLNFATPEKLSENSCLSVKYYKKRGINKSDAINIIKMIQSKNSKKSNKFLGKNHSEISKKTISKKMSMYIRNVGVDIWTSHFGDLSTSKIELNLYEYIKTNINNTVQSNISVEGLLPDITDLNSKKIVELYGDFWHANPKFFNGTDIHKFNNKTVEKMWEEDFSRLEFLKSKGYKILIVWEYDWKNNKNKEIERLKNFYD